MPRKVKWRRKHRVLFRVAIKDDELPDLVGLMKEDGLVCNLGLDGSYEWTLGSYSLSNKAVRDAWDLGKGQYARIMDYIFVNDPWGGNDDA